MKSANLIAVVVFALSITACGSIKPPVQKTTGEHQETVGAVQITYDDDANWTKITSTGTATHDGNPNSVSEAAKVAKMRALANITSFLTSDVRSTKTVDVTTKTVKTSSSGSSDNGDLDTTETKQSDGNSKTITTVVERIKENSASVLRGSQLTKQTNEPDYVTVEVTITKRSITASRDIANDMRGNGK